MVTGTKKLEFICLANSGRSEPARIIAQDYLEQCDLTDQYTAISSGTGVDDIAAGKESPTFKIQMIRKAVARGIYGNSGDAIATGLENSDPDISQRYNTDPVYHALVDHAFSTAKRVFKAEEHTNRDAALKGAGLEGKLKAAPEQTVARADVIAVFPMAKVNVDKVRAIYTTAGYAQAIEGLKSYVTGNPADEVANAFGEPTSTYHHMFDELRNFVPRAVNKAIAQHERKSELWSGSP